MPQYPTRRPCSLEASMGVAGARSNEGTRRLRYGTWHAGAPNHSPWPGAGAPPAQPNPQLPQAVCLSHR